MKVYELTGLKNSVCSNSIWYDITGKFEGLVLIFCTNETLKGVCPCFPNKELTYSPANKENFTKIKVTDRLLTIIMNKKLLGEI